MKVDILILNYNGKELLCAFLPSVLRAAQNSSHTCRVWVIDNLSSDGSVDFLKGNFPNVSVFLAKENKVLCSYNDIIKELNSEVVILLNNDIKVKEDFIDYSVENFNDSRVCFVAPCILNFDNSYNGGRSHLEFRGGIVKSIVEGEKAFLKGTTQSIATGAFRREMFISLGGFDELYLPGIWEEVDLCYRALQRGLKGLYEPRSIIWHKEATTFKKEYGERKKMVFAHRNMFLFFWKNITDLKMIVIHCLLLVPLLIFSLLRGKSEFVEGFLKALLKFPAVLKRRDLQFKQKQPLLSDRELIIWA